MCTAVGVRLLSAPFLARAVLCPVGVCATAAPLALPRFASFVRARLAVGCLAAAPEVGCARGPMPPAFRPASVGRFEAVFGSVLRRRGARSTRRAMMAEVVPVAAAAVDAVRRGG